MQRIEKISKLLKQGEICEINRELEQEGCEGNAKLCILKVLIEIFKVEIKNNVDFSVLDYTQELDELVRHFVKVKLLLRRLDFNLPVTYYKELYEYCSATGVSDYFLTWIIFHNIFDVEGTCLRLAELFYDNEGRDSARGHYFENLFIVGKELLL